MGLKLKKVAKIIGGAVLGYFTGGLLLPGLAIPGLASSAATAGSALSAGGLVGGALGAAAGAGVGGGLFDIPQVPQPPALSPASAQYLVGGKLRSKVVYDPATQITTTEYFPDPDQEKLDKDVLAVANKYIGGPTTEQTAEREKTITDYRTSQTAPIAEYYDQLKAQL